jgi:hypothetical protein
MRWRRNKEQEEENRQKVYEKENVEMEWGAKKKTQRRKRS